MLNPETPNPVRYGLLAMAAWLACLMLASLLPSQPGLDTVFGGWVGEGVQLAAAALCALAARRMTGPPRLAWMLIASGIVVWTLGDAYWLAVLADADPVPVPSPADVGYLLFVPLVLGGMVILIQAGSPSVSATVVADTVIVALAAATIGAAFVIDPVATNATGGTIAVATNVAYPITDLMLLTAVLAAVSLGGWRVEPMWSLLGAGAVAFFVADSMYLITTANGTYVESGIFDAGWIGSPVLFAAAAWARREPARSRGRSTTLQDVALPLCLAFVAISVALFQPRDGGETAAMLLGAGCVAAVMVRLLLSFRQNLTMIEAALKEALTDSLTGLGNRRALMKELERMLETATDGEPIVLALFDLDGFKHYNDSFGHPAGDSLLRRLGASLERSIRGRGTAYRMGGDEFCVLVQPGAEVAQPVLETAASALSEQGNGFQIGCSYGAVTLPREAQSAEEALRLADQRMYAVKNGGRGRAGRESTDVLWHALRERDAELSSHLEDVADLAEAVAIRLGMTAGEVEYVRMAARLHDIGKIAIPDAILQKPGPLDQRELAFIHSHTLIGERIIAAAPSLSAVARLVRSSHEHFDGSGYPDRLAGTQIPIGARIVAICDAFDAMLSDRSYRAAMDPAAALAELQRCAGSQFDPVAVQAFVEEWGSRQEAVPAGGSARRTARSPSP